jgi:hypothetical protein
MKTLIEFMICGSAILIVLSLLREDILAWAKLKKEQKSSKEEIK